MMLKEVAGIPRHVCPTQLGSVKVPAATVIGIA
jgi:hypothetical protein